MDENDLDLIATLTNLSDLVDKERSLTPNGNIFPGDDGKGSEDSANQSQGSSFLCLYGSQSYSSPHTTDTSPVSLLSVGTPHSLRSRSNTSELTGFEPLLPIFPPSSTSSFVPFPTTPLTSFIQTATKKKKRARKGGVADDLDGNLPSNHAMIDEMAFGQGKKRKKQRTTPSKPKTTTPKAPSPKKGKKVRKRADIPQLYKPLHRQNVDLEGGGSVSIDILRPYFHRKLPDAAGFLGISPTKLKQVLESPFLFYFILESVCRSPGLQA